MSETITLPRSGVVLKRYRLPHERGHEDDWIADAEIRIRLYRGCISGDRWWAQVGETTPRTECGSKEAAINALDARVLALRAALLPADARERVRRVLDVPALADVDTGDLADAVLAALGIGDGR